MLLFGMRTFVCCTAFGRIPLHRFIPRFNGFASIVRFADTKVPIFYGNVTDYFKLLAQDEHSMLIGARYVITSHLCRFGLHGN